MTLSNTVPVEIQSAPALRALEIGASVMNPLINISKDKMIMCTHLLHQHGDNGDTTTIQMQNGAGSRTMLEGYQNKKDLSACKLCTRCSVIQVKAGDDLSEIKTDVVSAGMPDYRVCTGSLQGYLHEIETWT